MKEGGKNDVLLSKLEHETPLLVDHVLVHPFFFSNTFSLSLFFNNNHHISHIHPKHGCWNRLCRGCNSIQIMTIRGLIFLVSLIAIIYLEKWWIIQLSAGWLVQASRVNKPDWRYANTRFDTFAACTNTMRTFLKRQGTVRPRIQLISKEYLIFLSLWIGSSILILVNKWCGPHTALF